MTHPAARRVVVRAPVRLDLGGGWTDVPPYPATEGGFVCNLAIARHATVTLGGPDPSATNDRVIAAALDRAGIADVAARCQSDFPVGSGLGGSSAAGVAAAAAAAIWTGELAASALDRATLAERSRATEVDALGVPGGRQDHYAAAFGGALALTFDADAVHVQRIALTPTTRSALERQLLVVYTGESRISGVTISAVMNAYVNGDRRTVAALAAMRALGGQMASALTTGTVGDIGPLLGEHWTHQRALHPAIPTPRIDAIVAAAAAAGATGAKALGASGGGCVLVAAPDDAVEQVRAAITRLGELVPFSLDDDGVRALES